MSADRPSTANRPNASNFIACVMDAIKARLAELRLCYWVDGPEKAWILEQMAIETVRLDRIRQREEILRVIEGERAATCWDEDRRAEAEEIAAGLAKRPTQVTRRLQRFKQGAELLIDRWRALASLLETQGCWTRAQDAAAQDLLGVKPDLRDSELMENPGPMVAREIERLERLKARSLDALDAIEREGAEKGFRPSPSRAMMALRRERESCLRTYNYFAEQMLEHRFPVPRLAPEPEPSISPDTERTQRDSGQDDAARNGDGAASRGTQAPAMNRRDRRARAASRDGSRK